MAEINVAYSKGDEGGISGILERYRDRLNPLDNDDIGTRLVRAIRSIARTRERISGLQQAIEELNASEWATIKAKVDEGEKLGEDLLGQLAEKLHGEILAEQQHLSELLTAPHGEIESKREISLQTSVSNIASEATPEAVIFHPENLIHRTERGDMVRSKSEAIIANTLNNLGIDYRYEYPIEGRMRLGIRRPDFVIFDVSKKPLLWEHLGMLNDPDYQARWKSKLEWYEMNGFSTGVDLFITRDEANGGLDSQRIRKIADYINSLIKA